MAALVLQTLKDESLRYLLFYFFFALFKLESNCTDFQEQLIGMDQLVLVDLANVAYRIQILTTRVIALRNAVRCIGFCYPTKFGYVKKKSCDTQLPG